MIRELYTEDLDINLKYNIYLHCVQNDDVILNINVYDKSLQADLSNYTCRLKAFKSDHIPLIQNTNIDVTGNVVKIEASKQLTTTAGIVKAELQFTDKSTLKKKSTFFIEIKVEKSALNVDGALSTPMCTLLEEIDNKLDQIENIGQVLDEAKQVRDTLESDIVVGNTTNENIVQSISDADSKKREVEISISNASDKISEVEDSITNADNSRNALDRSKEVANETKIDLDNANVQAEKNIEELNKLGDVTDLAAKVQTNTENISKNNKSIEEVNSHLNERANKGFIINSDFQIWQRGESFTLGGSPQYSSDRWAVGSSTSQALKIEKVDSGLKMTWLKQEIGVITQYLELPDKKRLIGKKISVSISINNIIYTYTTILDDINKYINFDLSNKVFTVETHADTKYYIRLFHSNAPIGTTYEINHIRDVFGSVSNFIPISYGEELALCQRYYLRYGSGKSYLHYFNYVWENAGLAVGNIYLPVTPRQMPTINSFGKFAINHGTYTENSLFVDANQSYGNCIHISFQGSGVVGQGGFFRTNNDLTSYIEFDSEIY
ncbi:hypothetical protein [Clostridium sp. HMSC19A10]|uniref:hypothetical protein n=1 Tax=Clostridium sp. HMSC19A10 TaxID=1581148 RepID=UPI0008A3BE6E|nr:hypothetical protein [Clostridium sp. HMSC19A10]OFS20980.1 hypothetical protein HMPREF3070_15905 [Clostridium sp. HMSC19A10]